MFLQQMLTGQGKLSLDHALNGVLRVGKYGLRGLQREKSVGGLESLRETMREAWASASMPNQTNREASYGRQLPGLLKQAGKGDAAEGGQAK